jgi:hypothetical protein
MSIPFALTLTHGLRQIKGEKKFVSGVSKQLVSAFAETAVR